MSSAAEFSQWPDVATVETDRYCDGCGYNVRTRPVKREPRTGLLVTLCPECGRFHAAGELTTRSKLWPGRIATILIIGWGGLLVSNFAGLALAQLATQMFLIENMYTSRRMVYSAGANPVVYRQPLYELPESRQYREVLTLSALMSIGVSFFGFAALVVVCPHWRRLIYGLVAAGMPLAAALIVCLLIRWDPPGSSGRWCYPFIVGSTLVQMLGGVLGVMLGRPIARGLAVMFLPPRLRQALAFLWIADGKAPPGGTVEARSGRAPSDRHEEAIENDSTRPADAST